MTNFLEPWYAALRANIGVAVQTNDTTICKMKLYAARKDVGDPDLQGLSILVSPISPATELWIVKRHGEQQTPDETFDETL